MHSLRVAASFGALAGLAAGYQGFSGSCHTIFLSQNSPWVLSATCDKNGGGGVDDTTIELGSCLVNRNGVIKFGHGGSFGSSCKGCDLSVSSNGDYYIACTCTTDSGGKHFTDIDLDNVIGNSNGKLVC